MLVCGAFFQATTTGVAAGVNESFRHARHVFRSTRFDLSGIIKIAERFLPVTMPMLDG